GVEAKSFSEGRFVHLAFEALPSNLRTDEPPPVLVGPPFGGAHPFRRTGLKQIADKQSVVLGSAAVLPAQDGPHHGPRQMDRLAGRALVVAVGGQVLINPPCHVRRPPSM